ncbi:hypothetical protein MPER_05640, partial [Moniliophthora perniciosa FA553]
MNQDEGYTDELELDVANATLTPLHLWSQAAANAGKMDLLAGLGSAQDCEELAYRLLASLPRSRLATIQRRIAPLLQFDVVG